MRIPGLAGVVDTEAYRQNQLGADFTVSKAIAGIRGGVQRPYKFRETRKQSEMCKIPAILIFVHHHQINGDSLHHHT
jgi:hypothetical protein